MRKGKHLKTLSIKTRVTLFTLAIFLLSLWTLAFYADYMLREDMERISGDQQLSATSFAAIEIDHELADRLRALEKVSLHINPAWLGDGPALQAFLDQQWAIQGMFNGGIFITGTDGTVIADVPLSARRLGLNYLERDYIDGALRRGKATIGQPVLGKKTSAPVFTMVVPVRDAQGQVIAALAGATNLSQPNFLDMLKNSRYGKSGSYTLVARQSRLVVSTSENTRSLEQLPAAGVDALTDRRMQGYEGTDIFVDQNGVEVLSSVKAVPTAAWYLAVSLPTAEALASERDMHQRLLLVTVLLTLVAGILTWWMMRRQLAPMLQTVEKLVLLAQPGQQPAPLPIERADEIGHLIAAFNHLLEELGQRSQALRSSEKRYRALVDWSPEAILVHREGKLVYVNPAAVELFGATSAQELLALDAFVWVHVDFRQAELEHLQDMDDIDVVGTNQPMFEEKFLRLDGSVMDVEVTSTAILYNGLLATQMAVRDITARQKMQEEVRHLAFYDPLTNLPNRRLLGDRLSQALAESKRSDRYGALMFLDLDNFKALNDSQGHAVGDLLLVQAAQRMKDCVREVDTVARLGGDEFVVLLSDLTSNKVDATTQATSIAEKIRSALAQPYQLSVKHAGQADTLVEHQCSASIGVVLFIDREGSQEDFLKWADAAMYQAKAAGANLIRVHS